MLCVCSWIKSKNHSMRDVLNLLAYGLIMFALIFGSILFYNAVAINFSIELIKNFTYSS